MLSIYFFLDMPQLKIDEEIYQKLVKIAGIIQAKTGRKISLKDAIAYLVDYYVSKENIKI